MVPFAITTQGWETGLTFELEFKHRLRLVPISCKRRDHVFASIGLAYQKE